jgi:quercetin dioxygenase-like cupin family protein
MDTPSKPVKIVFGAGRFGAPELFSYVDGAVLCRALGKKPAGSVTLLAFDQSQGLSVHAAPFDGPVQGVEGETESVISGELHRLRNGEMILLPVNRPHAVKAMKRFKLLLKDIRS